MFIHRIRLVEADLFHLILSLLIPCSSFQVDAGSYAPGDDDLLPFPVLRDLSVVEALFASRLAGISGGCSNSRAAKAANLSKIGICVKSEIEIEPTPPFRNQNTQHREGSALSLAP